MSARRLLFYTNKAATGWAALARRNCAALALPSCTSVPYCDALARRIGTTPALRATLARCNGSAGFLLDRIALGLEAEGIPYTEALDKTINEFLNENVEINEFLNKNLEDVNQGSEGETQKYSELDKIESKLQSFEEHYFSLLNHENEKFKRDIEKMCSELRYEIDKVIARQRLDLNLERERVRDELAKQYAKMTGLITKLDREIHTLQAQWELQNTQ